MLRRGITLIELLIAIAIVAIIAGVVFPVLVHAKKSAKSTSDLSALHQLGLAGALYKEQAEKEPRGTFDVVNAGLVPKELCSGLADSVPEGLANRVAQQRKDSVQGRTDIAPVAYRNSFVGWRETGLKDDEFKDVQPSTIGWLIDDSGAEGGIIGNALYGRSGAYLRVLRDTSVVRRQHSRVRVKSGDHYVNCEADAFFFGDWTISDMELYCKKSM